QSDPILKNVKKDLEAAAFAHENLNLVIPETYANPLKNTYEYLKRNKLGSIKYIFSRIKGYTIETIRFSGAARAWQTLFDDDKNNFDLDTFDLNREKLPESKAYSAGWLSKNFLCGDWFSGRAEKNALKNNVPVLNVNHDLKLYEQIKTESGQTDWRPADENASDVKSFSERIFNDWQSSDKQLSLEDFDKNWDKGDKKGVNKRVEVVEVSTIDNTVSFDNILMALQLLHKKHSNSDGLKRIISEMKMLKSIKSYTEEERLSTMNRRVKAIITGDKVDNEQLKNKKFGLFGGRHQDVQNLYGEIIKGNFSLKESSSFHELLSLSSDQTASHKAS
ncbi:MAG: hypothetical protein QNK11_00675, partial [Legionella sp.]|nr:hypothetical protein [Legionella sp.]